MWNMYYIFQMAASFNRDLSCWDVSKVSNWGRTFFHVARLIRNCAGLTESTLTPRSDDMFVGSNGSIAIEALALVLARLKCW